MQRPERRLARLRRGTAEINVVPFVDIALVLLVVFMVGAPLATQGVSVRLPETRPANLAVAAGSPLVITVTRDGAYSLAGAGGVPLVRDLEQLARQIRLLVRRGQAPRVLVRADAGVDYGRVARLLVEVRAAGVPDLGLVTRIAPAAEQETERAP